MKFDAALTEDADSIAREHLLQHFAIGEYQEELCFALWRPSTGTSRTTALIDEIILPLGGERILHGNASFQPDYMARAIALARQKDAGLAFMHSHPGPGWQGMSEPDIKAERDVLAYPAQATGFPLVGLTTGSDGTWSARFWSKDNGRMNRSWCEKTRVIGPKSYRLHFNDTLAPPTPRRDILRRTYDTWGEDTQNEISRLRVGVVGLGSVGSVVAEMAARIGVGQITLIDPDKIEEHNLDRLLNATAADLGNPKVEVAAAALRTHSTSDRLEITSLPLSIRDTIAYGAALDCDILFSCVDRPMARDILNFIATAHLIPVIDGGISIEHDPHLQRFFSSHWRAHFVTPYHQCLRCSGQYNSSMVVAELDGSLDNPTYIRNLPPEAAQGNQNVFPFAVSVAAMQFNLLLRHLLSVNWWPDVHRQEHQFITGETLATQDTCQPHCTFRPRKALGDSERPFYLVAAPPMEPVSSDETRKNRLLTFADRLWRILSRKRSGHAS